MKNILMTVCTLLIVIFIILLMFKGITLGNIQILSVNQIIEKNSNLTEKINFVNTLNNVNYKKVLSDLNIATKQLEKAKSDYLDIASVSTEDELKVANQEQSYSMEYLWSQIGNNATSQGVNLKLEVKPTGVSNKNNLEFNVSGSYIGIRNFIYSLENDSNLNFKIENFSLGLGKTENETLACTFTVLDIAIKEEQVSSSVILSEDNNSKNTQNVSNTINE